MEPIEDFEAPWIKYASFWIGKGRSDDRIMAEMLKRFKGVDSSYFDKAILMGKELLDMKEKTKFLRPDDPLRKILGGLTPPGSNTYINARVPFFRLPRTKDDKAETWREVQWRGSWDDPWEAILAYMQGVADSLQSIMYSTYGSDYDIGELVIDSTIWFQHPQQL